MRNNESYPKIKNALMNSYKDGKLKYSMFVRSSFSEIQRLSELFFLSEIITSLEEDTGIDIFYNTFWNAYNRHRSKRQNVITKEVLKPSNSVSEFGGKSRVVMPEIEKDESYNGDYQWLDGISMHPKLKEEIVRLEMTESEFNDANINIHNALIGVKQLVEYSVSKNLDKNSKNFFNK